MPAQPKRVLFDASVVLCLIIGSLLGTSGLCAAQMPLAPALLGPLSPTLVPTSPSLTNNPLFGPALPDSTDTLGHPYVDLGSVMPPIQPVPLREVGTISPHRKFTLNVGGGKLLDLPVPASSVFVADPSIADVQPPGSSSVFVFGKKPGMTSLFVLNHDGRPILAYTLVVEFDLNVLQQAINEAAPGFSVRLLRIPHGLVLQGRVPTPEAAANLKSIAQGYAGPGELVLDQLQVESSTQVNLRVRVAEVSRSVSRQIGFNWNLIGRAGSFAIGLQTGLATGALSTLNSLGTASTTLSSSGNSLSSAVSSSHVNGSTVIDAMADEGLVTLLAEPNLTTSSGQPASFLAGGEYPIPIPQGLGSVGIQYKQYGVSVGFTPTVLSNGMISMKVSPEVSELSTAGQYSFTGGSNVPALITRRADTTVQVGSGQSFAIGGLIQNNAQNDVSKVPWLGDLPVIGALFRSTQFQRDETELVIVVTAYVVHPTDTIPALPTDYVRQTTDLERLLLDRVVARAPHGFDPERAPHLFGAAGFMFE